MGHVFGTPEAMANVDFLYRHGHGLQKLNASKLIMVCIRNIPEVVHHYNHGMIEIVRGSQNTSLDYLHKDFLTALLVLIFPFLHSHALQTNVSKFIIFLI